MMEIQMNIETSEMQTTKDNSNYALRQIVVLLRLHV